MQNDRLDQEPNRRQFLRAAAGGAVAAAVGLPVLAACTGTQRAGAGTQAARLPTYVPFKGPAPDLPASAAGVEAGYFAYPTSLVRSVHEPPGRGGDVTAMTVTYSPPPTPVERNPAWQEMNHRLGVNLKFAIAGINDYQAKLSTTMASGSLPDLLYLQRGGGPTPAHLGDFVKATCADLSPYLAGDAVREYPNLANIPTLTWKTGVFDGRIYGVSIPRPVFDWNLFVRRNLLDQAGLVQPRDADDFTRLMKDLTRPQSGQWGIAAFSGYGIRFFQQLFRVPNAWRLEPSGRLVRDIETDENKAAVDYVRQLLAAGVFHPDSGPSLTSTQRKVLFVSGKAAAVGDGFTAYSGYWNQMTRSSPNVKVRVMAPFGHDGGRGVYYLGSGANQPVVMRRARPDRIRELLRVLNLVAAPFGTEEHFLMHYGVRDVDHRLDSRGSPVLTDAGMLDVTAVPWGYLAAGPGVLYNADASDPKEYAQVVHDQEELLLSTALEDPTIGFESPTNNERGGQLSQTLTDRLNDVMSGRAPLSAYDDAVQEWRSGGGEQIRKELQQALARDRR